MGKSYYTTDKQCSMEGDINLCNTKKGCIPIPESKKLVSAPFSKIFRNLENQTIKIFSIMCYR